MGSLTPQSSCGSGSCYTLIHCNSLLLCNALHHPLLPLIHLRWNDLSRCYSANSTTHAPESRRHGSVKRCCYRCCNRCNSKTSVCWRRPAVPRRPVRQPLLCDRLRTPHHPRVASRLAVRPSPPAAPRGSASSPCCGSIRRDSPPPNCVCCLGPKSP